jgi:hypothetical protein
MTRKGVHGDSEQSIFERDGQYLTGEVETAAITLGSVVKIGSADGKVETAGLGDTGVLGVAIAGYRTSRIATDNEVAIGNPVTICTRGVVIVTASVGGATRGVLAQAGASGEAEDVTVTTSATDAPKVIGMFLTSGASGDKVKLKLFRG